MMWFASIRQIAQMTIIPSTIKFRRLTKSLHFVLGQLHSVPRDSRIFKNRFRWSCQRGYWNYLSSWDIICGSS
jgi:hypothetical protein